MLHTEPMNQTEEHCSSVSSAYRRIAKSAATHIHISSIATALSIVCLECESTRNAPVGRLDGEPPDDAPHLVGLRRLPPIGRHGQPDDQLVRLLQSKQEQERGGKLVSAPAAGGRRRSPDSPRYAKAWSGRGQNPREGGGPQERH